MAVAAAMLMAALLSPTSASAATTYPKFGQSGAKVRALQVKLIETGQLAAHYNSGNFGTRTRTAIKAVQKKHQLKATGKINAATMKAIDASRKAMTGPRTWYHSETIGLSSGGKRITAYRAGEKGKPVVVVTATMHGEENFGQYVARGLLEGKRITGVDLWVVPVLNPDGLAKDRRWLNSGIDLNRNFPNRFKVRANSGKKAASERETKVIMKFLDRVRPRYLVSWHQPLLGVDSYRGKDKALMKRLSTELRIKTRSLDCHGSCHGTMTGWYNENYAGAAITIEHSSTARSLKTMKVRDANAVLKAVGGKRGKTPLN